MKTGLLEFLGQLLSAGGALFGLIYETPSLSSLGPTFRGLFVFSPSPQAAVGLAGFALAALGSFAAIVLGQLRQEDHNIGALLLFWVNFVVLLLGDGVFYALQPAATVVMLLGVTSAVLTSLGLLVIIQKPQNPGSGMP